MQIDTLDSKEQKRIGVRLAVTSAGTNHLACFTRIVIGETTSSSVLKHLVVPFVGFSHKNIVNKVMEG